MKCALDRGATARGTGLTAAEPDAGAGREAGPHMFPSLFVSHGSPEILITESPARDFLSGLGTALGRPDAILVGSADWETAEPALNAVEANATIHDFGGFPAPLYAMQYPAPGSPALAEKAAALLREAGLPVRMDTRRGLDHGAWVPLILAYPAADIPVVQLSVQPRQGPRIIWRSAGRCGLCAKKACSSLGPAASRTISTNISASLPTGASRNG